MLYVRKLFTQDLRDGKQIAFPKEPSLSFFSFDYINKEDDRSITFIFRAAFKEFIEYEGTVIKTRLYAAGSEARMDGEVKAFVRDKLNAQVGDLLIFKNKGTKHTEYEVMFLPQSNPSYSTLLALGNGDNHSVCCYDIIPPILNKDLPLQQIYYGAPGTGKSFEIDGITKEYDTIRTTFHPDSDYSTFVGAYKPMMEEVDVQIVPVAVAGGITLDTNKGTYKEKRITYKFVKQAFLKAYLAAWKKYADCKDGEEVQPQFLVIEEINRGNCAQIFGDLFQLLDRQDNGFSSYPIEADADLQREIAEAFAEDKDYKLPDGTLQLDGVVKNYNGKLADDIRSGRILLLPCNLYIWATMNTSDQSLFPIDSAFKRRWDWHYVKISKGKDKETGKDLEYKIQCGDETCDWWTFISAMNEKIAAETSSDDKKLGYFFCKPTKEGEPISVKRFVSKVMFYLWNDVFKDGDTKDFNVCDDPNKTATFEAFYNDDNSANVANVRKFLVNIVSEENLKKEIINSNAEDQEENDNSDGKDHTKYAINGEGLYSKRQIAVGLISKFIEQNQKMSASEVAEAWKRLGEEINIGYIAETQEDYDNDTRTTKDVRLHKIMCNGEPLWIGTHGWGTVEKMNELQTALSNRDWNLTISEVKK